MNTNPIQPAWLRDDLIESNPKIITNSSHGLIADDKTDTSSIASESKPNFLSAAGLSSTDKIERHKTILFGIMKIITLGLCVLMAATSVLGLGSIKSLDESGRIYVAIYMFFFSSLLFIFELLTIYKIEWLDHLYKRNFGFLFTTLGKAFFIIFIAFLSFGLESPKTLCQITGISWALFGVGIITLYLKYPILFE